MQGDMLGLGVPLLTAEECEAYVKELLPELQGLDGRGEALLTFCKGNPLRLEEGLRVMVLRRIIAETTPGQLTLQPLPAGSLGLSDMLRRRRRLLPVDTRGLLQLAAATADSFDVETLIELSGQPRSWVTDSLSHALQACMMTRTTSMRNACGSSAKPPVSPSTVAWRRRSGHACTICSAPAPSAVRGCGAAMMEAGICSSPVATGRGLLSVGKPIEIVVSNMPTPKAWTATIELNANSLNTRYRR